MAPGGLGGGQHPITPQNTPKHPKIPTHVGPCRAQGTVPAASTPQLPARRGTQRCRRPPCAHPTNSPCPKATPAGGVRGTECGGGCLAWGLARSQSDGGLPPPPTRPPDMQANICAQTSQDGEKEFHSCAHLRLGRLALTPSPPRGMDAGGGEVPSWCPPPQPSQHGGQRGKERDGARGQRWPPTGRAWPCW